MTARRGFELRVLGPIEATVDGTALRIGGRRQRALLALLAMQPGRAMAVDRLIDEIWAGEPPSGADVTLRTYVSRLRTTLGDTPAIRISAAGYSLDVDPDQVDLVRFERLVRDGERAAAQRHPRQAAERLREALALWQGRPFGDLGDLGALRAEAERLEELRLHALELRIEADLAHGTAGSLVDELEALVRDHPYREAFWRQLMLALYRAERQADALEAYHRARFALDEQLGLEPGAELQALEAAILRQDVPAARPPEARHNLPSPITTFVGRELEIARAARQLTTTRLLTMTGVGGVGKTRLAIETARAMTDEFADGVVFVDLAPVVDPELVVRHVLDVLDVREQLGIDAIDRLGRHLRSIELLLVLDNCEHLRDAVAELTARLLATAPALRILATSREVLGVPGETDFSVPPLALVAATDDPGVVRASEAVRLFFARAREGRPDLSDDDATVATVARICSDLDGLPLGIELAAARARALAPAEIAARLRNRFQFLVSWRRLASARHRTLREAMDWSHDLLAADEQRLLAELSVFADGFTLEATAGVCTALAADRPLELIERLVDASLVTVDQSVDPTRYRVLETVRQYGAERLEESGRTAEVRDRHAREFGRFAEEAWAPLRNSGVQAAWMDRIHQDRANLRVALTWSLDRADHDLALRIAESVWWYWWIRGDLSEGREALERALAGAQASDSTLRARGLLGLAGLRWALGDIAAAEPAAEEARQMFESLGNSLQTGNALNTLGLLAYGRHDNLRARECFEAAIERFNAADVDPAVRERNRGVTIDNLGSVAHELGDAATAMARYREARAINDARHDEEGVAMNDLHMAVVLGEAGEWREARRLLCGALTVYRRVEFLHYVAECLEATAMVANGARAPREAAFALGAAYRVREQLGNQPVPFMLRLRERETASARAALGNEEFDRAFAEGSGGAINASIDRAIAYLAG
jgi:predicted ATPase/DNA-binding SARP family transcriptional activator